jgi:hypothetical protein
MPKNFLKMVRHGVVLLAAGLAAAGAQASLVGSSATCSITPTPLWVCNTAGATVVDPGEEFRLVLAGSDFFSIDIDANSLKITLVSRGGLVMGAGELAHFGGLGAAAAVTGFTSAGEAGFDLSDVSFSGGVLDLNLNGSSWAPGDSATISFDTSVPEPGSVALVGLALAAAALARRQRR